jgi:hypothetical protein
MERNAMTRCTTIQNAKAVSPVSKIPGLTHGADGLTLVRDAAKARSLKIKTNVKAGAVDAFIWFHHSV